MTNPDTSLKRISSLVANMLRNEGTCFIQDIVNFVISSMVTNKSDVTFKRRVYDVINVLAAANVITKNQNIVAWTGTDYISNTNEIIAKMKKKDDSETIEQRISGKIENRRYKLNLLKHYNSICCKNSLNPRPKQSVHLPIIIFTAENAETSGSSCNLTVNFITHTKPHLYTTLDVLQSIEFRFDMDEQLISKYPKLKKAIDLIAESDNI